MLLFISVWHEIGINIRQIILIKNGYEKVYYFFPYDVCGMCIS